MSLEEAYWFLKKKRPVVAPNFGFLQELGKFEDIYYRGQTPTLFVNKQISGKQILIPEFCLSLIRDFPALVCIHS